MYVVCCRLIPPTEPFLFSNKQQSLEMAQKGSKHINLGYTHQNENYLSLMMM